MIQGVNYPTVGTIYDSFELYDRGIDSLLSGSEKATNYERSYDLLEQVHRVLYFNANPSAEIVVRVVNNPPSILTKLEAGVLNMVYAYPYLPFILLDAGAWILAFAFVIWPYFKKERILETFRDIKFYKKALLYFGIYAVTGVIIWTGTLFIGGAVIMSSSMLIPTLSWIGILIMFSPFVVTPLVCARIIPKIEKKTKVPNLFGRLLLTVVVTIILYFIISTMLLLVF
jgi:hypothetical protein